MAKRSPAAVCRAAVVLLVLAVAVMAGPACSRAASTAADEGAGLRLIDGVPRGCAAGGCVFLDTAALRDHFPGIYAGYRESFRFLDDYGVAFDDVDLLACAGLSLFLLEGRFDPARVREELAARDYMRTAYLGAEVWEGPAAGLGDWVAMVGGTMAAGHRNSVIDCLEVIIEGQDSLRAHPEVDGVVERLPPGLDMSVAALALDDSLLAHGESLQRIDDNTLELTVVRSYFGPAAAEEGAGEIARDVQGLLPLPLRKVRVQREGQFVTLRAEVAPQAIAAGLAAG